MHVDLIHVNAPNTYFYFLARIDFYLFVEHTRTMKTENTPLLEARLAAGLTQKDLAVSLGIDQGHLSRIERNLCQPKSDLAALIVSKFKGRLDELKILYPERYMDRAKGGKK